MQFEQSCTVLLPNLSAHNNDLIHQHAHEHPRLAPSKPHMQTSLWKFLEVNKNQNCQRPDRVFTNNLVVDGAVLQHDSLSHTEYQLR